MKGKNIYRSIYVYVYIYYIQGSGILYVGLKREREMASKCYANGCIVYAENQSVESVARGGGED